MILPPDPWALFKNDITNKCSCIMITLNGMFYRKTIIKNILFPNKCKLTTKHSRVRVYLSPY